MNNNEYFIITGESYDARLRGPFTKEQVDEALLPDQLGEPSMYARRDMLSHVPGPVKDRQPWVVIIKGQIVVPKAVETVTRYEVE